MSVKCAENWSKTEDRKQKVTFQHIWQSSENCWSRMTVNIIVNIGQLRSQLICNSLNRYLPATKKENYYEFMVDNCVKYSISIFMVRYIVRHRNIQLTVKIKCVNLVLLISSCIVNFTTNPQMHDT